MSSSLPCYTTKTWLPGTWDELHKKVTDLYPNPIEGLQLNIKRHLSKHFFVKHIYTLSKIVPTGYKFQGHFTGNKQIGQLEKYPVIDGCIMPNGNLVGSIVHSLGCRCRFKLFMQIAKNEYKQCTSILEYRSDDFTVSTKMANIDIFKQFGMLSLQYLQALSPRWCEYNSIDIGEFFYSLIFCKILLPNFST